MRLKPCKWGYIYIFITKIIVKNNNFQRSRKNIILAVDVSMCFYMSFERWEWMNWSNGVL